MFLFVQQHLSEIFIGLFAITVITDLSYYLILFSKFAFYKPEKNVQFNQPPVSIVIATQNDAHNLKRSLPILLTQQYNDYEVLVVSDHPDDDTEMVMAEFLEQYPNIVKYVNLTSSVTHIKGKKFPLALGINAAKYDIVLLTEPNCVPVSQYWLQNMARHFDGKKEIVLGYGNYEREAKLSNLLLRFDTLHNAMQYFSYALAKSPCMGVGRNLAYTKRLFLKNNGFSSHYHIMYGEDDLFVNQVATADNCTIECFGESFVRATPEYSLSSWLKEKRKHNFTRHYYKPKHKFLLGTYDLMMPLFYLFFALALVFSIPNFIALYIIGGLFLLKTLTQYVIFGLSAKKLHESNFIPFILLYDILFALLNPLIYIATKLTIKPIKKWK